MSRRSKAPCVTFRAMALNRSAGSRILAAATGVLAPLSSDICFINRILVPSIVLFESPLFRSVSRPPLA